MSKILRAFLLIFKCLNWILFVIPSRYSLFVLFGYNFAIYLYFGKWSAEAVQRELGHGSFAYFLFNLFVAFPMFWAFICCWSAAKMTSAGFNNKVNTALNNAIAYRNGQIGNKTAKEAFDIYKDTAHLDLMKANQGNASFNKAIQGFNVEFGNKTPQEVFNAFTKKEN